MSHIFNGLCWGIDVLRGHKLIIFWRENSQHSSRWLFTGIPTRANFAPDNFPHNLCSVSQGINTLRQPKMLWASTSTSWLIIVLLPSQNLKQKNSYVKRRYDLGCIDKYTAPNSEHTEGGRSPNPSIEVSAPPPPPPPKKKNNTRTHGNGHKQTDRQT